jgi:hypothetical protein
LIIATVKLGCAHKSAGLVENVEATRSFEFGLFAARDDGVSHSMIRVASSIRLAWRSRSSCSLPAGSDRASFPVVPGLK